MDRKKSVVNHTDKMGNFVEVVDIEEPNNGKGNKAKSPSEICEMGLKLGVISKKNERMVRNRIKELEGLVDSGKKAQQIQVNQ